VIRALFILVMVALLALPLGGWWFAQRPLPPLDGVVSVPELSGPAIVNFDGRSVPYVQATSEADAYLAQGYLTARDRLFQMDMLRRTALGQLSAVFGPGSLPQDKLMRTIGFGRLAEAELGQLSPEVRDGLEAYCRGVNSYLRSNRDRLPLEFTLCGYRPGDWQAKDTLAVMKYLAYVEDESWGLDQLRQRMVDKLGPDVAAELFAEDWANTPVVGSRPACPGRQKLDLELRELFRQAHFLGEPEPTFGSTAWVLSGKDSDSGGPLLACDQHTLCSLPDLFYLCSLSAPGLHVAGATIPGVPGVVVGRNESIAWATASLKADVQDLFLEQFSPRFPNRYRTAAGWQTASEFEELIPVRLAKDVVHKVVVTAHGPILIRNNDTAISLAWTGNTVETPALECLWKLNRASSWEDCLQALSKYPGPSASFIYADRSGNIGFHAAGAVPIRQGSGQGTLLVPGWGKDGEWIARVPFSDLPQSYNPGSGFLVAANQKLTASSYRWLIGHQWCAPYRAFRAASELGKITNSGQKAGLPDMNGLQADQFSQLSDLVRREIRDSIVRTELVDRLQLTAIDLMEHWDGTLRADSPAAAIYESFLYTLARRLLEPRLGPQLTAEYMKRWPLWITFVERYLRLKPTQWLPPEERTHSTFVVTTFSQALKNLRLACHSEDLAKWSWQSVHSVRFPHLITHALPWLGLLLDIGPLGVGGDQDSLYAINVAENGPGGQFASDAGPTMRMLVDLAHPEELYQSTSLGQSGQFFSPFQRDQLKAWLRVDPLPLAFSSTQIDRLSQHKLILSNSPTAGLE